MGVQGGKRREDNGIWRGRGRVWWEWRARSDGPGAGWRTAGLYRRVSRWTCTTTTPRPLRVRTSDYTDPPQTNPSLGTVLYERRILTDSRDTRPEPFLPLGNGAGELCSTNLGVPLPRTFHPRPSDPPEGAPSAHHPPVLWLRLGSLLTSSRLGEEASSEGWCERGCRCSGAPATGGQGRPPARGRAVSPPTSTPAGVKFVSMLYLCKPKCSLHPLINEM